MTISTVKEALRRIEHSWPESPILVLPEKRRGMVNTVFYNTVESRRIAKTQSIIGVFHYQTLNQAREILKDYE